MRCDNFKIAEIAKAYLKISQSSYISIVNEWDEWTGEVIFTKNDQIMPLFAGSVVCAKEGKRRIRAVISFDEESGRCEIAHAYLDIEDNIKWKLCESVKGVVWWTRISLLAE